MARFGTYSNDPREITLRYDSTCGETGKLLKKGTRAVYYPSAKKAYDLDSKTAKDFYSAAFDNDVLGANY